MPPPPLPGTSNPPALLAARHRCSLTAQCPTPPSAHRHYFCFAFLASSFFLRRASAAARLASSSASRRASSSACAQNQNVTNGQRFTSRLVRWASALASGRLQCWDGLVPSAPAGQGLCTDTPRRVLQQTAGLMQVAAGGACVSLRASFPHCHRTGSPCPPTQRGLQCVTHPRTPTPTRPQTEFSHMPPSSSTAPARTFCRSSSSRRRSSSSACAHKRGRRLSAHRSSCHLSSPHIEAGASCRGTTIKTCPSEQCRPRQSHHFRTHKQRPPLLCRPAQWGRRPYARAHA